MPTVIQDGNWRKFWWCGFGEVPAGSRNEKLETDMIYYAEQNLTSGVVSYPIIVLYPEFAWESRYTCDPSVVKGEFLNPDDQITYSYALYYTATSETSGLNNYIGIAFSNDGYNWVKYSSNPIIGPQVAYQAGDNVYGVGQASTHNRNSFGAEIYMFHTDSSVNPPEIVVRLSQDCGYSYYPACDVNNRSIHCLGIVGFAFITKPAAIRSIPIYKCRDGTIDFVSNDVNCEGCSNLGLLVYILPAKVPQ